jgi:EAL domain-containing protein (putative c-di-GMP-specific phosphodiesterase class I)
VNISALNFQQADFCGHIISLVEEEGDLAQYLELEITETAMMQNPEKALNAIETLKNFGFSIALDDFGTGHSSLGYLKKFPIDRIKIDRTFIKEIEDSSQDRNITSVIVQLAKHLDKAVIAEGIENEQQAYLLHVMGCNEIQGYFISRPIPAEQVPEFLAQEMKKIKNIVGY